MKQLRSLLVGAFLVAGSWLLADGIYIEAKAWLAQRLLQDAWLETRSGAERVRPWPWADTWPVARLQVERLGVDQVVLSGASGRTLAFAPGHIDGTATPGRGGNSVISGHRDTHFHFLRSLRRGDIIDLTLPDGRGLRYAVTRRSIHDERDTWLLDQSLTRLTLITCFPFDALVPGGEKRYVVIAKPVLI
ncbi:MAG: class GN sortase [Sedimenticola sp.]